ncbi:unnamed protein product, partial [Ectocarpus sp. 12 AP-2014]
MRFDKLMCMENSFCYDRSFGVCFSTRVSGRLWDKFSSRRHRCSLSICAPTQTRSAHVHSEAEICCRHVDSLVRRAMRWLLGPLGVDSNNVFFFSIPWCVSLG